MFFYVEECYYLVQPVKVLSQRCEEICKDVMKLKNSTFFFYQHNKNTVPQNETIPQNSTVHHQIFEQIVNNCTQKKCIENYQDVQRQCDFDGELYLKWMYFCWIVLRTIGKLYTGNSAKNVKQFYSLLFFFWTLNIFNLLGLVFSEIFINKIFLNNQFFARYADKYYIKYKVHVLFLFAGYGDIVPRSLPGRCLTIIYSICFIPLNAVELVFTGRLITNLFKLVVLNIEEVLLRRKKVFWIHRKVLFIQMTTLISIMLVHAWILHSMAMQNESFINCIYFIYITLSTIGFGDISFDVNYLASLSPVEHLLMGTVDPILFYLGFSMLSSLIDSVVSLRAEQAEE